MDCSKCIFAEVKPPENDGMFGLWQHGCGAGRLNKLKQRREATLLEKSDEVEQHTYYCAYYYIANRFYATDCICKLANKGRVYRPVLVKDMSDSCTFVAAPTQACTVSLYFPGFVYNL